MSLLWLIIYAAIVACLVYGVYHLAKSYPDKIFKAAFWWLNKNTERPEVEFYVVGNPGHETRYICDRERAKEVTKNVSKRVGKPIRVDRSAVSVFGLDGDTELRVEKTKATTRVLVEKDGDSGG